MSFECYVFNFLLLDRFTDIKCYYFNKVLLLILESLLFYLRDYLPIYLTIKDF